MKWKSAKIDFDRARQSGELRIEQEDNTVLILPLWNIRPTGPNEPVAHKRGRQPAHDGLYHRWQTKAGKIRRRRIKS